MSGGPRRLLARPIRESERRQAFLIAAGVLIAAAVALSLAREPQHAPHPSLTSRPAAAQPPAAAESTTPARIRAPSSIPTPDGGQLTGTAPPAVMAAGRAFLLAYLRFSYGQAPPRFPSATRALAAQLARFHVAVGPGLRARRLTLLAMRADPRAGGFEVGALAADGASSFPIAAILRRVAGRWLAVRVVTAAAGP